MAEQPNTQPDTRTDAERFEQGLQTILTTPKKKVVEYMEGKKAERKAKRESKKTGQK